MAENDENHQKNAGENSELKGNSNCEEESGKKENLLGFTKQLVSLGALQQAIVRNLQKEIENL